MNNHKESSSNDSAASKEISDLVDKEARYESLPIWSRALMLAISGSVLFGFIYACVARIDEVIIAKGELQALGAERPIKAPIPGVIDKILVKEGEAVEADQILITFDKSALLAREDSLISKLKGLKESYVLEQIIYQQIFTLSEQGAMPSLEALRQRDKVSRIQSDIAQTEASYREIQYESSKTVLRSPVNGRVFDLVPASSGYISSLGETLLKVVPQGDMEAKVFITNADIGFIRLDMKAQVRIDAFPFTQFGSIEGELKRIAEEVLPPDNQFPFSRYPAYVKLNRQLLKHNDLSYKLRSGQSVSVNFIVRDKPVISLLTDALEKALDSLRGIKSEQN